jgi:hypothetical protein
MPFFCAKTRNKIYIFALLKNIQKNSMKFKYFLVLFFLPLILLSQERNNFTEYEDSLTSMFNTLFENNGVKYTKTDAEKDTLNKIIETYFSEALNQENSFNYSFSKIKKIGNIFSDNQNLRIITWNLKYSNGEYKYFGFIQHINKSKKRIDTWKLTDESAQMVNKPEDLSLYHNHWYGALYYDIVQVSDMGNKYYTILGWDGNNFLSQKKIIEVLYFTNSGIPKFGKNIFKCDKKSPKRVIFEYKGDIVMSLNYDKRYKKIVFDHLRPDPKIMKDHFEFYVTDGSYDAFEFYAGKWRIIEEFNAQNEKPDKELPQKKATEKELYKLHNEK